MQAAKRPKGRAIRSPITIISRPKTDQMSYNLVGGKRTHFRLSFEKKAPYLVAYASGSVRWSLMESNASCPEQCFIAVSFEKQAPYHVAYAPGSVSRVK